jgi:ethylmalonyl-CoA mutase
VPQPVEQPHPGEGVVGPARTEDGVERDLAGVAVGVDRAGGEDLVGPLGGGLERGEVAREAVPGRDRPWLMRTYSGALDRRARRRRPTSCTGALEPRQGGQTGLSVAFDLPTQTGYDADHVLARGEVGKVGVPVCSIDDMRTLFDGIPLGEMNTSMTINATAAWLLALYVASAKEQGADPASLQGTTQNDIVKEYLSRGTYVFPPGPSMRLTSDVIVHTVREIPKWNPINICSYHLQEVGATPVQEVAYAMANATAVLDAVRPPARCPTRSSARSSAASASSSTPASGSSPRSRSSAR